MMWSVLIVMAVLVFSHMLNTFEALWLLYEPPG